MSLSELQPAQKIFKLNHNYVRGKNPSNAERRYVDSDQAYTMFNTIGGDEHAHALLDLKSETSDENLVNLYGSEHTPYEAKAKK